MVETKNGAEAAVSYGAKINWMFCGVKKEAFGTLSLMRSSTFPKYFVLYCDGPNGKDRICLPPDVKWKVSKKNLITATRGIKARRITIYFGKAPNTPCTGVEAMEATVGYYDQLLVEALEHANQVVGDHQEKNEY